MTNLKVKNKQLAKLREFRKGMDVEDFLQNEFKQILRALQNQYISQSEIDVAGSVIGLSNYIESSTCGTTFSTTGTADVTNLNVKLTTRGGTVVVGLKADGLFSGYMGVNSTGASVLAYFHIARDNSYVASTQVGSNFTGTTNASISIPSSSFCFTLTNLPAGTYTFKAVAEAAVGTAIVRNTKLFAYELF